MATLLIADDHPLFRAALRGAAVEAEAGTGIIEAGTLDDTIAALESHPDIDLVLLDLHMPGNHGLAGLAALRAQFPAVAVVLVSANEDPQVIRRALDHGAAGYIPKSAGLDEMREAISALGVRDLDARVAAFVPPLIREMEREHGSLIRAMRRQGAQRRREARQPSGGGQSGARHSLFVTIRTGIRTLVDEIRLALEHPLIAEIPGPDGAMAGRKTLRQFVQEAVGIRDKRVSDDIAVGVGPWPVEGAGHAAVDGGGVRHHRAEG